MSTKSLVELLHRAAAAIETPADLTKAELNHVAEDLNIEAEALKVDTNISTVEGYDEFLDDITHTIHAVWTERGGRELSNDEMYALNDLLTAFFDSKK